jgi:hypothetical protein
MSRTVAAFTWFLDDGKKIGKVEFSLSKQQSDMLTDPSKARIQWSTKNVPLISYNILQVHNQIPDNGLLKLNQSITESCFII